MNRIFALLFIFSLWMGSPSVAQANTRIEIIDNVEDINISISDGVLRVTGANGQVLSLYNVAGVKVMSVRVDGAEKSFDLNNMPKGCYIVKVGKVVRKIAIK